MQRRTPRHLDILLGAGAPLMNTYVSFCHLTRTARCGDCRRRTSIQRAIPLLTAGQAGSSLTYLSSLYPPALSVAQVAKITGETPQTIRDRVSSGTYQTVVQGRPEACFPTHRCRRVYR